MKRHAVVWFWAGKEWVPTTRYLFSPTGKIVSQLRELKEELEQKGYRAQIGCRHQLPDPLISPSFGLEGGKVEHVLPSI